MKNLLLVVVSLVFSLSSFSQEKYRSDCILENNTLKYVGKLDGKILSFLMTTEYNGFTKTFTSNDGGNLTDEMIKSINNLSKYYNEGDTTLVIFKKIVITSGKNSKDRIKLGPLIEEIIF